MGQIKSGALTGLSMGEARHGCQSLPQERKRPHMIYIDGERRMSQVAADRATVLGLIQEILRAARDARRE